MDEPKSHRSVSQINTYLDCSEAYRIRYVDKPEMPPRPAAWLAQGLAYHETVQAWEESGRSGLLDLGKTFMLYYDRHIEEMRQEQPNLGLWLRAPSKKTEQDILERRSRGLDQVQGYVDDAEINPFAIWNLDEYTDAIEVDFQVLFGEILVKGGIDQIRVEPNGLHVVDLKTGNRVPGTLQLGTYKVAVEKIFNMPVSRASFFYAKDSKLISLSKDQLDRYSYEYLTDLYSALDRGIENRVFIPNPGGHCTLCPYKSKCREFN